MENVPRIDCHILYYNTLCLLSPSEFQAHLLTLPLNYYHLKGSYPFSTTRLQAFLLGNKEYVTFIDDDDRVVGNPYDICIYELDNNPHIGGVYTNSIKNASGVSELFYSPHVWTLERHFICPAIHQCIVIRRCVIEQAVKLVLNMNYSEEQIECLLFAVCATIAPFKFLDFVGYEWYCKPNSTHTQHMNYNTNRELRCSLLRTALQLRNPCI